MSDVKAIQRRSMTDNVQRPWSAAFKWGGYWHTLKDKHGRSFGFATADAARAAARKRLAALRPWGVRKDNDRPPSNRTRIAA